LKIKKQKAKRKKQKDLAHGSGTGHGIKGEKTRQKNERTEKWNRPL